MAAQVRGRVSRAAGAMLTPGQHLRAEMQRLGLDQNSLSAALGVSRQAINNIVNDRHPISRAMAGRLARITGHASDYWLQQSFAASGRRSAREARPAGVLVRQQILRAVDEGTIGIAPFHPAQVRLASVDLTLHAAVDLKKGELVAARTREQVEFPLDYFARLGAAGHLAARGVVALLAPQIEPSFKGHVQVSLFNAGGADVTLAAGAPIVSLEVVALAAAPVPEGRGGAEPGRTVRGGRVT